MLLLGLSPLNFQYTTKFITTYSYDGDVLVCDARSPLVQSLPIEGILELLNRLRLPEPDPVHLELRRLLFELLQGALDNQYLLADLSTHKPFTSIH